MASGEAAAVQTFVLRVSIHCQGCKKKVRKVLKSVEGVHDVKVDAAQHKVTVTGTVDATTLVRRLHKSGKQALPWQYPPAAPAKNPDADAVPAEPEALPAPPAGDGDKDNAAADKRPEEPVKKQQAESPDKKPEQEAASEKKPEAEKETEPEKKAEKVEAKPSDETKKDGGDKEAAEPKAKGSEPAKEAAAAPAKESGNDDAKEPVATAAGRSPSPAPAPAPRHADEAYNPYYAPQPVMSYHMAQPRGSVSYYAPQPEKAYSMQQQPPPQQHAAYPMQQHAAYSQQAQPMQQWSPSYLYMPYPHASPESYYHDYYSPPGTHASPPPPPPLQDSYRLFDDENPNSCSVM